MPDSIREAVSPTRPASSRPPTPALRWFSADDVHAAMPPIEQRLQLAEVTLTALARPGAAQLPPKIAIHPRPAASFVHAMPAHLRGDEASGDLLGMKWVAGYATNGEIGLPAISAVVILNDAATGVPTALLDGGPITAQRTAAVSGLAIRRFGPRPEPGLEVALIGAGVQGHSHLPVLAHVLPGLRLRLFDPSGERAKTLAAAAGSTTGVADVTIVGTAREAVEGARVVVSAASFGRKEDAQSLTNDWLHPEATVVPIDYATYCNAAVAREAALFLVDQREQYLYNREMGNFDGYPDPHATLGEAILAGTKRPAGRVVLTHLGVGLADVVFADAIVQAAIAAGRGTTLQR